MHARHERMTTPPAEKQYKQIKQIPPVMDERLNSPANDLLKENPGPNPSPPFDQTLR
jgi:hypothetical protein